MPTEAKTEHAKYLFRASEHGDGSAFIWAELIDGPPLTVLGNGFISFELRDTSLEHAVEVAGLLNQYVESTGTTVFDNHPLFTQMKGR
jgi:hypothetical protein